LTTEANGLGKKKEERNEGSAQSDGRILPCPKKHLSQRRIKIDRWKERAVVPREKRGYSYVDPPRGPPRTWEAIPLRILPWNSSQERGKSAIITAQTLEKRKGKVDQRRYSPQ